MKILLTGKDGQLGSELRRTLPALGALVAVGRAECDLADAPALEHLLSTVRPDLIVNAAAWTAVDRAESDPAGAFALNARVPEILGRYAAANDAWVLHYSTDYVFDGRKATPYDEDDLPNPQNVYGASKRAGEIALADSGARYLIFRTSWVYGIHGANFVKTMLRLAAERDAIDVVADQWGAPTPAALLADISAEVIRRAGPPVPPDFPWGIYHVAPAGETQWHGYARHVIERARAAGWPVRLPPTALRAVNTADYPTPARRPANSRLSSRKLQQVFGLSLPDWQVLLDGVLDELLAAGIQR